MGLLHLKIINLQTLEIVLALVQGLVEAFDDEEDTLVVTLETAADTKGLAPLQTLAPVTILLPALGAQDQTCRDQHQHQQAGA